MASATSDVQVDATTAVRSSEGRVAPPRASLYDNATIVLSESGGASMAASMRRRCAPLLVKQPQREGADDTSR
jgi:hypothetical protein